MTGMAGSSFDYARIGLNVLHPPALEGRKYRLLTSDGVLEGVIPEGIGPQPFVDGEYYPLLPAFRSLELDLEGPVAAHFEFSGDEFELEDQRNWLDASYKSYSTPMSLGLLHADPGQSIAQEVRVRAEGPPPGRSSPPATGRGRVRAAARGGGSGRRLPRHRPRAPGRRPRPERRRARAARKAPTRPPARRPAVVVGRRGGSCRSCRSRRARVRLRPRARRLRRYRVELRARPPQGGRRGTRGTRGTDQTPARVQRARARHVSGHRHGRP